MTPVPSYSLNCYPAKMSGSVIGIMLDYARRRPERAKEAMIVARADADFLLRISQPADAPLAHFPPTYRGEANTVKRTYLAIYKAERNPLDLAKARALGDTLANVQKADGSIRTQMLMRPDADNFWINCMGASIRALDLLAEATSPTAK